MKHVFFDRNKLSAFKKELVKHGYTGTSMYVKTVRPCVVIYIVNALFDDYIEVEQKACIDDFFITTPSWMGIEQFEKFALYAIDKIKNLSDDD